MTVSTNRRDFLKAAGTCLSTSLPVFGVAGGPPPVSVAPDHFIPVEKQLDPQWIRSLTAKGERTFYQGDELEVIGMPVGGIGCGQLYLAGDGRLLHWDIFNHVVNSGFGATTMSLYLILACSTLAAVEEPLVLDAFNYATTAASTAAWKSEGAAAPRPVGGKEETGIEIDLPFAARPGIDRVTLDREVRLDLANRREFTLDVVPANLTAVGEVTLYFRSGEGWYACAASLRRAAPHALRFAKTAFRTEGRPAGWDRIDRIRIAFWRGDGDDSKVQISRLAAWSGRARVADLPRAAKIVDPAREFRGFWNHSGAGAYPGDWERTARELQAAGFNAILPNQLWAGRAEYPSKLLPQGDSFKRHGDQVAQCVAAAHRHGLKVHVWKVNYNLGNAPRDFVDRMRREGRTQVSAAGKATDWLCPSHPENVKLEVDTMLEVARNYEIDGLHFDYIRYPDGDHCYCDGCRGRFEADTGRKVAQWPGDCHRGARRKEYRDWRCRQITRLVEAVSREGRAARPGIKISAAVFGAYPGCRSAVGQDWVAWAKAGFVDFLCPMNYTPSDDYFADLVASQVSLVEGKVPICAGIGATATRPPLSAERVLAQVEKARHLGAEGFVIFNLDGKTISTIAPAVGQGARRPSPGSPGRP